MRHEPLEPVQNLPHGIGIDSRIAVFVDEISAVTGEHRCREIAGIAPGTERQPEGMTRFVQCLGGSQKIVPVPLFRQFAIGRRVGRIHLPHVQPGMLLQQIDAAAARQCHRSLRNRHRGPGAVPKSPVPRPLQRLAETLDEAGGDITDRFETARISAGLSIRQMQDIVSGSGLRLGGNRQVELVALRGDKIEADIDLVLVPPLSRQTFPRLITTRHPVIPETDIERAARRGAVHERLGEASHGKGRRSDRGRSQQSAPGQPFRSHREPSPIAATRRNEPPPGDRTCTLLKYGYPRRRPSLPERRASQRAEPAIRCAAEADTGLRLALAPASPLAVVLYPFVAFDFLRGPSNRLIHRHSLLSRSARPACRSCPARYRSFAISTGAG